MVDFGDIRTWHPGAGQVTTWTASVASRAVMAQAPIDPLPPSRQLERSAALTLQSPQVQDWIGFAHDGRWPSFPLPAGDVSGAGPGIFLTEDLLDAEGTDAFAAACRGGFGEVARAAQTSFDANRMLAEAPLDRALELADGAGITIPRSSSPPMMVSFMDLQDTALSGLLDGAAPGLFADPLSGGGVNVWINRYRTGTTVTLSLPDTATARQSAQRYIDALRSAFVGAAAIGAGFIEQVLDHVNSAATAESR